MISGKKTTASLLMAIATVAFTTPAFSDELNDDTTGAKGLFLQQLSAPVNSEPVHTGVQYWIELHRSGNQSKVTNKFGFKNGDKIRFHVRPNINGYAYIFLKNGSRGESSVLFPDPAIGDDNTVRRGEDYIIPSQGFLTFDENPGTEKVSLVISRTPIDAQAFLNKPKDAPTLIASAMTGAKDLIPRRVLVHYSDNPTPVRIASSDIPEEKPVEVTPVKPSTKVTKIVGVKKNEKPQTKPQNKPVSIASKPPAVSTVKNAVLTKTVEPVPMNAGTVTVVSEVPTKLLHIDVDLTHI